MAGGGAASNELPQTVEDAFETLKRYAIGDPPEDAEHWLLDAAENNPYTNQVANDPTGHLSLYSTAIEDYRTARNNFGWFDWNQSAANSRPYADGMFPYDDIALDELANAAVVAATQSATAAATQTSTDASALINAALQHAGGAIKTIVQEADTKLDSILAERIPDAETEALDIARTDKALIAADALTLATNALGDAHDASEIATIINTIVTTLITRTTEVLEGAVATAGGVLTDPVLSGVLDDITTAFEDRARLAHNRAINRFTGGMADINAIHSSAFPMGLANLEAEFEVDIRKYQAEMEHDLFITGLQLFHGTFEKIFITDLQAYMQEIGAFLDSYKQDQSDEMQMFLTAFQQYLGTYLGILPQYLSTYQGIEKGYESVASGLYSGYLQHFGNTLTNHVRSVLTTRSERMQARDNYIGTAAQGIANMALANLDTYKNFADTYGIYTRSRIIAEQEYTEAEIDIDVRKARWKMDMAQLGANVVASGSGGAVIPTPPSRAQSVLAGIASGAGTAALAASAIPGVGTGLAVGMMGIGALLGGIGGAQ